MVHRFILHNDDICEATAPILAAGQIGVLSGWGVFSTLRVASGVPFAFERHWARMCRDARLLAVPLPEDPEYVRSRLLKLIQANAVTHATLRVAIVRNRGGLWEAPNERAFDLVALTADLKRWGAGVRLAVAEQARHAASPFRGVKMLSWALNLVQLERAQKRGFDEVILLNERGEVSECTSANIFVASGDTVFTPPLDSGCLPGVTRDLLVNEVRAAGVTVRERPLSMEDLYSASEVFITSTTRDLLPVLGIEDRVLTPSGDLRARLESAFRQYTDRYISTHPCRD